MMKTQTVCHDTTEIKVTKI